MTVFFNSINPYPSSYLFINLEIMYVNAFGRDTAVGLVFFIISDTSLIYFIKLSLSLPLYFCAASLSPCAAALAILPAPLIFIRRISLAILKTSSGNFI